MVHPVSGKKQRQFFSDYWNGSGAWERMDQLRKYKFVNVLKPNFHEWDSVMDETFASEEWNSTLPENSEFILSDNTVKSINALVRLFQNHMPEWSYLVYSGAGLIAPLRHPQIIIYFSRNTK